MTLAFYAGLGKSGYIIIGSGQKAADAFEPELPKLADCSAAVSR